MRYALPRRLVISDYFYSWRILLLRFKFEAIRLNVMESYDQYMVAHRFQPSDWLLDVLDSEMVSPESFDKEATALEWGICLTMVIPGKDPTNIGNLSRFELGPEGLQCRAIIIAPLECKLPSIN